MSIKDKNILITGAAGKIGSAAALKLFSNGANLIFCAFGKITFIQSYTSTIHNIY